MTSPSLKTLHYYDLREVLNYMQDAYDWGMKHRILSHLSENYNYTNGGYVGVDVKNCAGDEKIRQDFEDIARILDIGEDGIVNFYISW